MKAKHQCQKCNREFPNGQGLSAHIRWNKVCNPEGWAKKKRQNRKIGKRRKAMTAHRRMAVDEGDIDIRRIKVAGAPGGVPFCPHCGGSLTAHNIAAAM